MSFKFEPLNFGMSNWKKIVLGLAVLIFVIAALPVLIVSFTDSNSKDAFSNYISWALRARTDKKVVEGLIGGELSTEYLSQRGWDIFKEKNGYSISFGSRLSKKNAVAMNRIFQASELFFVGLITKEFMDELDIIPSVITLEFQEIEVEAVPLLFKFENVVLVQVFDSLDISGESLPIWKYCQTLNLAACPVTDEGVARIRLIKSIKQLNVTDDQLLSLKAKEELIADRDWERLEVGWQIIKDMK